MTAITFKIKIKSRKIHLKTLDSLSVKYACFMEDAWLSTLDRHILLLGLASCCTEIKSCKLLPLVGG